MTDEVANQLEVLLEDIGVVDQLVLEIDRVVGPAQAVKLSHCKRDFVTQDSLESFAQGAEEPVALDFLQDEVDVADDLHLLLDLQKKLGF